MGINAGGERSRNAQSGLELENKLFFGDNLFVLRDCIKDESVDLIYLDPPFNSNATYNVLFSTPKGYQSGAQIEAFDDTWHWGPQTELAFAELMQQSNTGVAEVVRALRSVLGQNDMMAYLVMMAVRLIELHRALKPTGSLYLHCDPTASHYLKIVLDQVFGAQNYRSEISWKRSSAHNDAKQGRRQYGNIRDVILFYTKSEEWKWNWLYTAYDQAYLDSSYKNLDPDGRRWKSSDLTGPGGAAKGNPEYELLGVTRFWRYSKENMMRLLAEGRIHQSKPGAVPRMKHYLDEMHGVPLQNSWDDIQPAQGSESVGYPTQKPLTLLERIIATSSNANDVVLDPFCGCGTAIHAAEKLNRKWIGIDVTHLAVSVIEKRMRDAFSDIRFEVFGTPKDLEGAHNLAERDKYQFQWWACSLVNAQPFGGKKKGADSGIDGLIFFQHDTKQIGKIVVSVKGGANVGVSMIRDLGHVVEREKAAIGLLVTLAPPSKPMLAEAAGAGFYTSPINDTRFPKLQILTIEELLNGTAQPRYPHLDAGGLTFKKAKRDNRSVTQGTLFEERGPTASVMDRRMALVCTLVNRLADEPHFGRTKMAKLFYLADATENLALDTTYYRKAAGPLDAEALYNAETGLEAFAIKHNYLSVEKTGRKITYRRGPDLGKVMDQAREILGSQRSALNRLIDRFRPLDTDQCEIVATLYACWNDRLMDGKDASKEAVIEEFLGAWHEKKRRFSRDRLHKALEWMNKAGLVPKGRGGHTKAATTKSGSPRRA